MISNLMRRYFKEFYDGASAIEMGYNDAEVGRFLTAAQQYIIKERLFDNRNPYLEGYESGSLRDTEFSELKRHIYIYNQPSQNRSVIVASDGTESYVIKWAEGIYPNSSIITLPSDFMYYAADYVDITHKGIKRKQMNVKNADEDNINDLLQNVFTKPNNKLVYRLTFNRVNSGNTGTKTSRRCLLVTDKDTTIDRYVISYLKQPNDIVVDTVIPTNQRHCELNEEIHLPIVQRAVMLALSSIASEKYQIALTEKQLNT